ncbi:methyltransferase domain-containing protein [Streptomyces sp. SID3212]|uniref:methyltransferase domain-containing protein n=1 Tax=Streptomyces sp. SID3212 TaxID=2690259 RepID=UPI0031F63F29
MPRPPAPDSHARTAGTRRLLPAIERTRSTPIPAAWADVLTRVPRDLFLPDEVWLRDSEGGYVSCDRRLDPGGWMGAAYSDAPLVTQFVTESDGTRSPSSSASMPSTVLRLLEDAELGPGTRTLEIGTGSGYNTALLCARLGDALVTSVEVDAPLAARARENLAALSYSPAVIHADGADGWLPHAPYDRVLATCSVRTVPTSWLEQTAPGGRIVTPWDSAWSCFGAVRLTKHRDGRADGTFAAYGSYMLINGQRTDIELFRDVLREGQTPETGTTALSPWAVAGDDPALDFHLGLTVPGAWYSWDTTSADAHTRLWIADTTATSWASVDHDGRRTDTFRTAQYGPRRLWDEIRASYERWTRAGQPAIGRYGLTVTPEGQTAWLDSPDTPVTPP